MDTVHFIKKETTQSSEKIGLYIIAVTCIFALIGMIYLADTSWLK